MAALSTFHFTTLSALSRNYPTTMEELINHLHDHGQIWEKSTATEAERIQVSEIWDIIPANEQHVFHTTINGYKLQKWLKTIRPDPKKPSPSRQQCSLRILWVKTGRKPHMQHMSESQVNAVVNVFKLRLAYTYYRTSSAGVTELSQCRDSSKKSQYGIQLPAKDGGNLATTAWSCGKHSSGWAGAFARAFSFKA